MVARLEAQHIVDEDRPVEVGFGEAIGVGSSSWCALRSVEPERIEIGGEMAHDAIGADQHQRADASLSGAQRRGGRQLVALAPCALRRAILSRSSRSAAAVVAVEGATMQFAVLCSCGQRALPRTGRGFAVALAACVLLQTLRKSAATRR